MKVYKENQNINRGRAVARDYESRQRAKRSGDNSRAETTQKIQPLSSSTLQLVKEEDLSHYEVRFYIRCYTGKAALIAAIVKKACAPFASDFGVEIMDEVIRRARELVLPESLSKEETVSTENPYRQSICDIYNQVVEEKDGRTDTQLGLRADYVDYR